MIDHTKFHVVGNWKQNPDTYQEAQKLFSGISNDYKRNVTAVACPPHLFAGLLSEKKSSIELGVQDISIHLNGAHTADVSVLHALSLGARYVILGHSERRTTYAEETNENINQKLHRALSVGLTPIVCVGEKERDEQGQYLDELESQIKETFKGLEKMEFENILIAYEPLWAIGSGNHATTQNVQEIVLFIKKVVGEMTGNDLVGRVHVLYGGSVKKTNIEEFIKETDIQGVLVGGASLDADHFNELISKASETFK